MPSPIVVAITCAGGNVNLVIEILRSGAPLDGRAQLAGCAAGGRRRGYFANNANPVVVLTTVAGLALLADVTCACRGLRPV